MKFRGGITFPNSPLTRAKHTYRRRAFGGETVFPFRGHSIEGHIPADWGELTFFMVFAVFHPQQWRG